MTPNQVALEEDLGYSISPNDGGDTYIRNTQFLPVDGSVKSDTQVSGSQST